jgi:hypothetical protein
MEPPQPEGRRLPSFDREAQVDQRGRTPNVQHDEALPTFARRSSSARVDASMSRRSPPIPVKDCKLGEREPAESRSPPRLREVTYCLALLGHLLGVREQASRRRDDDGA